MREKKEERKKDALSHWKWSRVGCPPLGLHDDQGGDFRDIIAQLSYLFNFIHTDMGKQRPRQRT